MSTALAVKEDRTPLTPDQIDLVKRTVAKDATTDELALYLHDCARQGVHPLDKLLHFTKRGGKYTPVTSIDLMRTRAADTGEYAGSDDALFTPKHEDVPIEATVTVYRLVQGQRCAFTATARWSEYYPGDQAGTMWRKMPHTMLAKCAEALALRKGFPRQLAGLYAREELDQAGSHGNGYVVEAPAVPSAPPPSPTVGVLPAAANGGEIAAPLPDGAVTLARVEMKPTRKENIRKFVITTSQGEEVTTIKERLGALCEQLAQEQTPVTLETKATKWGVDLVAVHPVDVKRAIVDDEAREMAEDPFSTECGKCGLALTKCTCIPF